VRKQLRRFSGAFVVSAQDQQEVKVIRGLPTVFLPNVPFGKAAQRSPIPQLKQVLFVGSLWYRPNADGINWYLQQVWPKVLATLPDARLTLVGAAPPHVRAAWATHHGVSAPGFVDDLATTYQQASLVVVPLHSGGGTNIKVLEALAHDRPCLMTDFVAKAFAGHLSDQSEILVATHAEDFVTQTLAALRHPERLQDLADAGQLAVQRLFSTELFKSRVADFARQVLIAPP
jgi:glycosyltransferase involved in cell wall biosynthesis